MNIFIKPLLGISLLGGALLIAGCNTAGTGTTTAEVAGDASKAEVRPVSDAPASTTAKGTEPDHDHSGAMPGMKPRTNTTKLAFSSAGGGVPVGKPTMWTLQITNAKTGASINDFEVEMTKQMHLIVVKNDLSWFNHIHPQFQGNGKFTVTTVLPSAGTYKIYADYTLKSAGQEVPQYEFATAGETVTPAKVSIVPDKMQGMWLVNKFNAHPESEPDAKGGAVYEVAMMPMPMPIVAGQDTMLHFQVRDSKGTPIKDLQPYLGAMGHCVILSSDTNSYLHSHPMSGGMEGMDHSMGNMKMDGMDHSMGGMKMDVPAPRSGGPDVMFHTNFPHDGLYKVWGQFQHKGKIITANFVVNVAPGQSQKSTNTADEVQPHSH
jgi:hypothetical protein